MSNLLIPVGMPGCGKSTWGKQFFDLKYTIVSSDAIRKKLWGSLREAHNPEFKAERNQKVWDQFYSLIENYLQHNVDVYADATNLRSMARQRLLNIGGRTNADVHLLLFDNSLEAWIRNEDRSEDQVVPSAVMLDFAVQHAQAVRDIETEPYDSITRISSVR